MQVSAEPELSTFRLPLIPAAVTYSISASMVQEASVRNETRESKQQEKPRKELVWIIRKRDLNTSNWYWIHGA